MEKVIVFGMGKKYDVVKQWIFSNYEIIALTDNEPKQRGKRANEGRIINPNDILKYEFDSVMVAAVGGAGEEIRIQLLDMGISLNRLITPISNAGGEISPCRLGSVYEHNGIKILINAYRDIWVFTEILLREEYLPPPASDEFVVIDIGMNIGIASLYYANFENVKKVYSYELFADTYQLALQNFALNQKISAKITPHPYGLGSENKTLVLEKTSSSGANNMFRISHIEKDSNVAECKIVKASEALNDIVSKVWWVGNKLMLKIDCEGAEWEIFDDLSQGGLLTVFDVIVGEWHILCDWNKKALLSKLKSQLKNAGFGFCEFIERWDSTGHFLARKNA